MERSFFTTALDTVRAGGQIQFGEAREQFVAALQKKPDWMVVQILIGKCDLQAGDKAGAKQAFERALQLAIEQNHEGPREEMEQMLGEMGE